MLSLNNMQDNVTTFVEIKNVYCIDSRVFINLVEEALLCYYFLSCKECIVEVYYDLMIGAFEVTSFINHYISIFSIGLKDSSEICKVHTSSGMIHSYLSSLSSSSILVIHIENDLVLLKNKYCF